MTEDRAVGLRTTRFGSKLLSNQFKNDVGSFRKVLQTNGGNWNWSLL